MTVRDRETILGYSVFAGGRDKCISEISSHLRDKHRECRWLACINPHSFVISRKDLAFSEALRKVDWLVPDGVGILLASRILGGTIRQRVTGSDVFFGVMSSLNQLKGSVFFLGSTPDVLDTITARVRKDFPQVQVVGCISPPFQSNFSEAELNLMVAEVNAVRPTVLWVGMTSPKQDLWIHSNLGRLQVQFAAGVGAVFDFYSGNISRAATPIQYLGLEWACRYLKQPLRMWNRVFVSNPIFLWHLLKKKFASFMENTQ